MEPSENRRQSEPLPSIMYRDFERTQREGIQFQQRHPSIARGSISTASPISPTTLRPPAQTFPSSSSANCANGYISPPESRRTSNEDAGRQSLPSLQEALLYDKLEKPGSFAAPSPMHTPPLGQGSFSNASAPHPPPMPRSQPAETLPSVQPPPPSSVSQIYHPPPPPPAPSTGPPPGPVHHHESYDHRHSHDHGRTLPPNPYSQAQAPPPIPAIRPPDSYPPPGSNSYQPHPYPAPPPPSSHHNSPPQYPPTPSYHNSGQPNQYPFPQPSQQQPQSQPQPQPQPQPQLQPQSQSQSQPQPPYTPQPATQQPYSYPPPDQPYSSHENAPSVQTSPGSNGGLKRNSYGSTIEKALSISTIRRELESTKENSARIYHLVQNYQDSLQGGPMGLASLDASIRFFEEALEYSARIADALLDTRRVLQDWSAKARAEQDAQKLNANHIPEYAGEDTHGYVEDTRPNGLQQPDTKKIRRGRAAPPGRCHSCQRAETPEWRRGPDGARTLCNACGLHYAKLTRKLSKNAMGNVGGALGGGRKPNSPLP